MQDGGDHRHRSGAATRSARALSDRSSVGSFIYLALALVITGGTSYRVDHPWIALTLVVGSALLGVVQLLLARRFDTLYATRPDVWSVSFSGVAYAFGVLWGALGAHAVLHFHQGRTLALVLIVIAGIVAGASTTLGPDRWRHTIYTCLMLGPAALGALALRAPGSVGLAICIVLYIAFTLAQGAIQRRSFFDALATELQLERKRLELEEAVQKARVAAEAKATFLANMSHELRTPMNAVIGMAEVASLDPDLPGSVRESLATVTASAADMVALIEDLLLLAESEKGLTLVEAPFSLRDALADGLRAAQAAARTQRLDFRWGIEGELPERVRGDAARFRKLVAFLADNAVKFTPRGAVTVTLSSLPVEGELSGVCRCALQVADTGVGIAREHLDRVFEPFQQADDGLSRRYTGAGLGLTLAAELVRAMGGDISLESVAEAGTSVTATVAFAAG